MSSGGPEVVIGKPSAVVAWLATWGEEQRWEAFMWSRSEAGGELLTAKRWQWR